MHAPARGRALSLRWVVCLSADLCAVVKPSPRRQRCAATVESESPPGFISPRSCLSPSPVLPPCRPVNPRRPVTRIAVQSSRPPAAAPSSKREMMNRLSKSRAFYTRPPIGTKYDIQLSQKQILAQRTVLFPHCARAAASLSCAFRRDWLVEKSPETALSPPPLCLCLPSALRLRSLANCT